jgi:phosphate transport system substrate-binding protein
MKNGYRIPCAVLGAVLMFGQAQAVLADDVKLAGAASVVTDLVAPHQKEVENSTGIKLVVDKSNAGKGLIDLIDGNCDAAMASASLDATVKAAKSAGLAKPVPDLKMQVLAKSEVVFIVHPANPVKKLTWEQIKEIHTGKITNWKELGGNDLPITVYTDAKASATRGLIKQVVMGNSEYADSARAVGYVKEVNDKVALDESGIGGLGSGFVDPGQVAVVDTKKIERPLGFITVGAPSAKVQKVMDAFKAVSAK